MAKVATFPPRTSSDSFASSIKPKKKYVRLQKNTGKEGYGKPTWANPEKVKELEPRFAELKKRLVSPENYVSAGELGQATACIGNK